MLLHNLCLCTGHAHPDYLLPYLTAEQFLDWGLFARQVGFGVGRDDAYWSMLLSMFYNAHRSEKASAQQPSDFMLYSEPEPKPVPKPEEVKHKLKAIFASRRLDTSWQSSHPLTS